MATTTAAPDAAVAKVRDHWDARAARYTETANRRITLQCAAQLYANMELETARSVLEVAGGAGLCAADAARRLASSENAEKTTFVVTDLSPTMVAMAQANLTDVAAEVSGRVELRVQEANGQDLVGFASASVDRYVAGLCLQLCPDPDALLREARRVLTSDGLAGFTIWARPEHSGLFAIDAQVAKEMGTGDGSDHPNFALGKDLEALRARFQLAGFRRVRVWPFLCVLEAWSGEAFGEFFHETFFFNATDDETRARRREIATRLGTQWFEEKQFPIGLETYIVLARP